MRDSTAGEHRSWAGAHKRNEHESGASGITEMQPRTNLPWLGPIYNDLAPSCFQTTQAT